MEQAVFGASEFFSKQAFITSLRGIDHVKTGYLKGRDVEVVEILFDPWKVSYNELLELFFDLHDPTSKEDHQPNRHSFIFFSDLSQLSLAKKKRDELKQLLKRKVITEIAPVWNI